MTTSHYSILIRLVFLELVLSSLETVAVLNPLLSFFPQAKQFATFLWGGCSLIFLAWTAMVLLWLRPFWISSPVSLLTLLQVALRQPLVRGL